MGSSEISFRVLVIIYSGSQGFFFVRTHDIFPTLRHAPWLIRFLGELIRVRATCPESKLESTMYHWTNL